MIKTLDRLGADKTIENRYGESAGPKYEAFMASYQNIIWLDLELTNGSACRYAKIPRERSSPFRRNPAGSGSAWRLSNAERSSGAASLSVRPRPGVVRFYEQTPASILEARGPRGCAAYRSGAPRIHSKVPGGGLHALQE